MASAYGRVTSCMVKVAIAFGIVLCLQAAACATGLPGSPLQQGSGPLGDESEPMPQPQMASDEADAEFENETDFEFSDELFSDPDVETPSATARVHERWRIGGYIKQDLAVGYQGPTATLSKLRTTANVALKTDLSPRWRTQCSVNGYYDGAYGLAGRSRFSEDTLAAHESRLELRDTFVAGPMFGNWHLKHGRQVVVWGESDFLQVTDVANPRDQTEFGLVDLEDARLPVWATHLTWLPGSWELNLLAIHEIRPNEIGAAGSDFDPFRSLRSRSLEIAPEKVPAIGLNHSEWAVRLFKAGNGGDLALIAASVYDDNAHLELDRVQFQNGLPIPVMTPRHDRYSLIGTAANRVTGDWLWKLEGAHIRGRALPRNDLGAQLAVDPAGNTVRSAKEADITQLLVGFDYSGILDLRLTLEGMATYIHDHHAYLAQDQISAMVFALASYQMLNETLQVDLQAAHFLQYHDTILKLELAYEPADALTLSGGVIYYHAPDDNSPVYTFREQGRIFAGLKWSF